MKCKTNSEFLDYNRELFDLQTIQDQLIINSYFMGELKKLGRLARQHHKLCERYCNEKDFNPELIEKKRNAVSKTLNELNLWLENHFNKSGLRVESQNDPRGDTIKVYLGDIRLYWVLQWKKFIKN